MSTNSLAQIEKNMVLSRDNILQKIENVFKTNAVEAHVFGSVSRGNADSYSDLDVWITFSDEIFEEIKNQRFEYYKQIGDILNICEPPQNAPLGGICSALLVKNDDVISMVDIYLCPLSTSFITSEGKKLSGIDLPQGEIKGFNSQTVQVPEDYRINFFIGFVFNTIKKIKRNEPTPLSAVIEQYNKFNTNYNIPVNPLIYDEQSFNTLEKIVENTKKFAAEKQ